MDRAARVVTDSRSEGDSAKVADIRSAEALGVLRLAVAVLLIIGVSTLLEIGGAVIVIGSILGMIMLHEFGHFITARWAGMRVTDFFVGFGPTLWSIKRGDTRYGVKGLPLGGFVRVIGMHNLEEVAPEDEPFTYRSKSYWQRVRFASAGSFMHFLIAFVLMAVLLAGFGVERPTTTIDAVATSLGHSGGPAPALAAGVRAGDKIVSIDGTPVSDWMQVPTLIDAAIGRPMQLVVEREGQQVSVAVTPVEAPLSEQEKVAGVPARGMIGIRTRLRIEKEALPVALWHAGFDVKTVTWESAKALVGLFTPDSARKYGEQLTKTGPADPATESNRLLSPVGIARIADATAERGVAQVLWLLVAINVFVGLFNMVPLPPFDGGHVAVATYEAIRSRIRKERYMVDMAKLAYLAYAVVVALFLLSASALWLDIVHPFKLG